MAAVCHFGIVMTSFQTIRVEYYGNVNSVLKFHSNKLLGFEDIEIFIFSTWLGLPNHTHFL